MNPYLYEMLHRVSTPLEKSSQGNSHFVEAFEKAVQEKVESLISNQLYENEFLSKEQLSKKIESEVRQAYDLSEFGEYISRAVGIFREEGFRYLDRESLDAILKGLDQLAINIDALDLENLNDAVFYQALEVFNEITVEILKIATSKFQEGLMQDSLAVFTFLTLVQSNEPDFWFRMGLVAQSDKNMELALRAFNCALDLNPELVGPHIYRAVGLFEKGLKQEAIDEIKAAKTKQKDKEWSEEIAAVEALVSAPEPSNGA